jgi:hypothetical protein
MPLNISRSMSLHGNQVESSHFVKQRNGFLDKETEALYSFENICETLGLHPDHIRKGLQVWKEAGIKMSSLQGHTAGRPKPARSAVKHPSVRLSKTA